jgi:hypothetical protein
LVITSSTGIPIPHNSQQKPHSPNKGSRLSLPSQLLNRSARHRSYLNIPSNTPSAPFPHSRIPILFPTPAPEILRPLPTSLHPPIPPSPPSHHQAWPRDESEFTLARQTTAINTPSAVEIYPSSTPIPTTHLLILFQNIAASNITHHKSSSISSDPLLLSLFLSSSLPLFLSSSLPLFTPSRSSPFGPSSLPQLSKIQISIPQNSIQHPSTQHLNPNPRL